jgi:hypothetical protein
MLYTLRSIIIISLVISCSGCTDFLINTSGTFVGNIISNKVIKEMEKEKEEEKK